MKEIEVKILGVHPPAVRKKLKMIGAPMFFKGSVRAVYFDTPSCELAKAGKELRVRTAGDRVELCVKSNKRLSRFKIADEIEVLTSSFDVTISLLNLLGFVKQKETVRVRECYSLGSVKFDLDLYKHIPPYIEVEGKTEKDVVDGVCMLGYTMAQTTNMTSHEVEDYYKNKDNTSSAVFAIHPKPSKKHKVRHD